MEQLVKKSPHGPEHVLGLADERGQVRGEPPLAGQLLAARCSSLSSSCIRAESHEPGSPWLRSRMRDAMTQCTRSRRPIGVSFSRSALEAMLRSSEPCGIPSMRQRWRSESKMRNHRNWGCAFVSGLRILCCARLPGWWNPISCARIMALRTAIRPLRRFPLLL